MNPTALKISFFFFSLLFSFSISAQERSIQGIVTTFDSIPIHGATIKVQSTKQEILTDSVGEYTAACNYKDKIKISAEGFYNQNVKIEKENAYVAVNLKLKDGAKNKEIALGYVSVSDRDKLNALTALNSNDVDFSQYRDMRDAIAGKIPGVQYTSGGIIIRGNGSINGPTYALIIIDGVSSDVSALDRMNPATVKSINVIKDGSSAMYGSKGAFGVIIIESKTGRDK
jgi:TonB-dependent SusC/RagA subfamily outer membrane receptor